jgi:hypothetical protein
LLHGLRAIGPTIGGKAACANLVGEHLEERDWVVHSIEGVVELQGSAECVPLAPIGLVGCCLAGIDASGNLVLAKAVDSPCCCSSIRWSICQDVACGKPRLKKEHNCESDRSHRWEAAWA